MRFKLPVLNEEFNAKTNEIVSTESEIDCELNFSMDAQVTWEESFPEQAKNIGLFDYVSKLQDIEIQDHATAGIALKIIYCFMLFDNKMSFREFVRMFSFANMHYFKRLCTTLENVIKFINERNDSKKKD